MAKEPSVTDEHYTCDGVVFHSDSELSLAMGFCESVNSIDCGDGQFPNIVTFDMFSAPNEQIISSLDRAVRSGRVVFCSDEYYQKVPFGYFSANVAMLSDCNFVKIKIRNNNSAASSSKRLQTIASFAGLPVEEDWSFNEVGKNKLRKLFGRNKSKTYTAMPELLDGDYLDVANPSMPSTTRSLGRETENIAGDSLESGSGASELHPQYPGCDQSLQAPENNVSGRPGQTPEGTYTFSGEQVCADENRLETKPAEDKEPEIAQDPLAVSTQIAQENSGYTITATESQAPLISPALHDDTTTQHREQSLLSRACSKDCSLCSYLSRCSTRSCATCGAVLVFVLVLAIVIVISAHFSNNR